MGKKTFPKLLRNEGTFAQENIVIIISKKCSLVISATYHVIFFSNHFFALRNFEAYLK
jgi:hypothetical protein